MRAVEAHLMHEPSKDWQPEIDEIKVLLKDTVLHFAERKRFNVYLQYLIGLNGIHLGDDDTIEASIIELQKIGEAAPFGRELPGLDELRLHHLK